MTRIGINPARHRASTYRPARITVGMLVYLPHLMGYFEHRLEVIKLSLATLTRHSDLPYDLLVFDNGSCEEVKVHLGRMRQEGLLRYLLTSSENIGKLGALRLMAGAAPGEVLAYTDDDTFFYPGWLSAHMALLDGFPNVGMVSGSPERTLFDHGIDSTLAFGRTDPAAALSYGRRIPESWEREWAVALGKAPDEYLRSVEDIDDIIIERKGLRAYATACHNQFVAPRRTLLRFLEGDWTGRLMGGLNELDNAIDAAGFLRLTTIERTTRLIGNVVSPTMQAEARRFGIDAEARAWRALAPKGKSILGRLLVRGPFRRLLQGLYNQLFSLLSGQSSQWLEREARSQEREP
ncbi:MAG TPA: glycosyltransferase family A protein [Anaerolineales bacterium]|nr:glycosyltransferase family A protein [Anaerolineales bacterium]